MSARNLLSLKPGDEMPGAAGRGLACSGDRGVRMAPGDLHWFVVRVAAMKEFVVQDLLDRRGFVTFLPYRRVFRWPNRYARQSGAAKQERRYPLQGMSGYVFVGFDPANVRLADLMWLHLIKGVVGSGDRPWRAPPRAIVRLMEHASLGYFKAPAHERFMPTHGEFAKGDVVDVIRGPLDARAVRVIEITDCFAQVMITILGCEREVTIHLANLRKSV